MAYMNMHKQSDNVLRLVREPSLLFLFCKGMILAFLLGLICYYISDFDVSFYKLLWESMLVVFVFARFEVCDINRKDAELTTASMGGLQYLLGTYLGYELWHVTNKVQLSDVKSIKLVKKKVNKLCTGHRIELNFEGGLKLPITKQFTTDNVRDHKEIAEVLRGCIQQALDTNLASADREIDEGDEENDDDFEKISYLEVEALKLEEASANQ